MVIDNLEIGETYYFGVPQEARVRSGTLLKINPSDRLEPSAEVLDDEGIGKYLTIPISLMSTTRKEAQALWKPVYSKSKNGKFSITSVTN